MLAAKKSKRYMGDGVYCEIINHVVILTTEDGLVVTNTIYLDSRVQEAVKRFIETEE